MKSKSIPFKVGDLVKSIDGELLGYTHHETPNVAVYTAKIMSLNIKWAASGSIKYIEMEFENCFASDDDNDGIYNTHYYKDWDQVHERIQLVNNKTITKHEIAKFAYQCIHEYQFWKRNGKTNVFMTEETTTKKILELFHEKFG